MGGYGGALKNISIDCDCDSNPTPPEQEDIGIGNKEYELVNIDQKYRKKDFTVKSFKYLMVGKTGFEPATPWSQTKCSTKLSHFPI